MVEKRLTKAFTVDLTPTHTLKSSAPRRKIQRRKLTKMPSKLLMHQGIRGVVDK